MKKSSILILLGVFLLFVLSGCGKKETRDFHIENHTWTFLEVVGSENPVSDLECSAVDETIDLDGYAIYFYDRESEK